MRPNVRWHGYAAAVVLVLLGIGLGFVFRRLPHANLSLLFLLAALLVAARWGLAPSIFASVLGFVALNFFFTEPQFTLAVEQQGDLATLVFYLAMAALTGNLAARARAETASNKAALGRVSALLDFSRKLGAAVGERQALQTLADEAAAVTSAQSLALSSNGVDAIVSGPADALRSAEGAIAAIEEAWRDRVGPARVGGWTCLPLATGRGRIGVLAVATTAMAHQQRQLLDGLCDQTAIAIERLRLADSLRTAELSSESERLRSALLASVSHDLRTPLASIIGSATSLLEYGGMMKEQDRRELLQTVRDESERLDRYIQNLLDMTRFGQQAFEPQREWVALHDVVGAAIRRLGSALTGREVEVEVAPAVAFIYVHGALLEQALVNLLDNAAEFAPAGSPITVRAFAADAETVIEITDRGPGIPPEEREKIFDMFYRVRHGDSRRQGSGLGLAICKSLLGAHGGTVQALAGEAGGTRMRLALPTDENPVGVSRG